MSVLTMQQHANLTGAKDWLLKLKDFLTARGWTIDSYLTDVLWQDTGGGVFGFVAGGGAGDDILFVSSNGFGSQNLFFRMKTTEDADPNSTFIEIGGHLNNTLDTASSTHPVSNGNWNSSRFQGSFPDAIPAAWFFGNDKFVCVVSKLDSTYVEYFTFGTLELVDTTETEGNFVGVTRTSTNQEWFDKSANNPFDNNNNTVFYNGAQKSNSEAGWNFTLTDSSNSFSNNKFFSYGNLVLVNDYSEIRPVTKQIMYVEDDVDGQWFELADSWVYRVRNDGLSIGEVIKFGTEEYVTFPYTKQNEFFNGVAVRIN